MSIERIVLMFAGILIFLSVALSQIHSVYWLGFTALIGLNMFQSAFTGFCPLAIVLKKLGKKSGTAFA